MMKVDGCVVSSAQVDDWVALVSIDDGLAALADDGLVSAVVETLVGDSLALDAGCASTSEDEVPSE